MLFSKLLEHGTMPTNSKIAKCIPIPEQGRTDTSIPKSVCPISLLNCLSKTFDKLLTQKLSAAGIKNGGITKEQMECLHNQSAIDTLIFNLTPPNQWPRPQSIHKLPDIHQSIMANDIDGAFHCVAHNQPNNILQLH